MWPKRIHLRNKTPPKRPRRGPGQPKTNSNSTKRPQDGFLGGRRYPRRCQDGRSQRSLFSSTLTSSLVSGFWGRTQGGVKTAEDSPKTTQPSQKAPKIIQKAKSTDSDTPWAAGPANYCNSHRHHELGPRGTGSLLGAERPWGRGI